MPEEKKSIYELKLHEELSLNKWLCVFRVPGGWIYQTSDPRYEWDNMAVFVPFSNQFYREEMKRVLTEYLSLEALSARLNLPQNYLRVLTDSSAIPSLDVNGRLRFSEPDVRDALSVLALKPKHNHDERKL